jgi:hypothetical protein
VFHYHLGNLRNMAVATLPPSFGKSREHGSSDLTTKGFEGKAVEKKLVHFNALLPMVSTHCSLISLGREAFKPEGYCKIPIYCSVDWGI